MSGALIVTAELAQPDFAWLDGLRKRHFPPERNQLSAHLTMFHAIPPSAEQELRTRLKAVTAGPRPSALIAGLMDLGGGVAFRVVSPDLDAVREDLAADLHGLLGAQDAGGWRPHVTIQNKVAPRVARDLRHSLEKDFEPRPLGISGLALHRYLGGPWETLAAYGFRNR
ncbi:MAG TPA: 2'-5' RNA ligase family protein [Planctomycetaceae bacterium]|nr:2'-5' RNA ligase family protein [Planctomycetaceae bacterium]